MFGNLCSQRIKSRNSLIVTLFLQCSVVCKYLHCVLLPLWLWPAKDGWFDATSSIGWAYSESRHSCPTSQPSLWIPGIHWLLLHAVEQRTLVHVREQRTMVHTLQNWFFATIQQKLLGGGIGLYFAGTSQLSQYWSSVPCLQSWIFVRFSASRQVQYYI